MPATSTARAHWTGSTLEGSGTVTTDSPALDATQLTWKSRIGEEAGTTPEELLAAGHAGCYAMAFSFALSNDGHTPETLDVAATFTFGPDDSGFSISGIKLSVEGTVPGIDEARFLELAEGAKDGCPVSKAFAGNLPIELDARLLQTA
ncbi:MAG: osmC [Thermoleophilia bacterium]|nr:osmC [Thermoleophilia bacterium]